MAVTWDYAIGPVNPQPGWNVLSDALDNGSIIGAQTSQFVLRQVPDPQFVVFYGDFTKNGPNIVSGTITGFDVFYGGQDNKLLEARGYAIDFAAFVQALAQYQTNNFVPMFELILGEPMTANGVNQAFLPEYIATGYADDTSQGFDGPDYLFDLAGSDVMYGGAGGDLMVGDLSTFGGAPGNDTMYGGEGDDEMAGGGGDDFMSGGPGKDVIDGEDGSDTADYSEKTDRLTIKLDGPNEIGVLVAGFVEDTIKNIENIVGGANDDKIVGDGFANTLVGNNGKDNLKGKDGDDHLSGRKGKDKLNGGRDDDTLSGGQKNDNLKGGQGKDTFLFDIKPKGKHADTIKDFKGKDAIGLDADVFTKVNDSGKLKSKYFVDGNGAKDKNDYVIYDDGSLYYDRDGSGGKKAVLIAKLKGDPNLDAGDIFII